MNIFIKKQTAAIFSFLCLTLLPPLPARAATPAIIPKPVSLSVKPGHFHFRDGISLGADSSLNSLAVFFAGQVRLGSGLDIGVNDIRDGGRHLIRFLLDSSHTELGDEGYRLQVRRHGILLTARKPVGIFYGIQTLFQLLPPEAEAVAGHADADRRKVPCLDIVDYPRFPYRGMHLDVCRHFFPVSFIKQYIELMSTFKMNTFHWHLTDDQGWRIEIKKYPLLTQVGAYRKGTQVAKSDVTDDAPYGGFYTQDEIRDVVAYAASCFITVIPEIEMPGHAVAALTAYPEYSCTGGPFEVRTTWGVADDIYCAGNDSAFLFLQDILEEVLALFPSKMIHIGGDEAPKTRWKGCPRCQARKLAENLKDEHELQSYFIGRIGKFLNAHGRKLIGWDEIMEGGLTPDAAVMSWQGISAGIAAARHGHDVVMTPGSHCYFDHYQADPAYEPLAIGGFTNLSKVYSFEPVPSELTATEARHILGAQGNLWTEYITTPEHAVYMAYPRAIALAEVNWSPAASRDWDDFVRRIEPLFARLDLKQVNYCKSLYDVDIATQVNRTGDGLEVVLGSDWKSLPIRFTLDGSDPGPRSSVYRYPFPIHKTVSLKAAVMMKKERKGRINEKQILVHLASGKKIILTNAYSDKYPGRGERTLTDGLRGSVSFRAGEWQGYHESDLEAVIDLGSLMTVTTVTATFIKNIFSWIHLPVSVEVALSTDGKEYLTHDRINWPAERFPGIEIRPFKADTKGSAARYVRIRAVNQRVNPGWHESAGLPCWLFVDEVVVE